MNLSFFKKTTLIFATQVLLATDNNIHINCFHKILDNFHVVQAGVLYRSAQLKSNRLTKYIKKYGIKSIINLRGKNENISWWENEKSLSKLLGVKFYNIPFNANSMSSKKNLNQLLFLYKNAPKPILIHCKNGIDRSGEAAALWILEQEGKNKNEALKQLSLRYGYFKLLHPAKHFLIKIWKDKLWMQEQYDPDLYGNKQKIKFIT